MGNKYKLLITSPCYRLRDVEKKLRVWGEEVETKERRVKS